MTKQEHIDIIVKDIMKSVKKSLVNRLVAMNPVEAMIVTAKELSNFGLPANVAVISVKAIMNDIGTDLGLECPYSQDEINSMMIELEKTFG